MEPGFWHERWQKGQIGFHEGKPNALLQKYLPRLELHDGSTILLPLCGKSTDLAFLARGGLDVTGVELVPEAVEAFFRENELRPDAESFGALPALRARVGSGQVRIATGSFFDLAVSGDERFDAAYDRAALVALPEELRERYVGTLVRSLQPLGRILLVTFVYEGEGMTGPPFSIGATEVKRLFAGARLTLLEEQDLIDREPRFRERGATSLVEQAWLIEPGRA